MTEMYLHFLFAHYGLFGNAPVAVESRVAQTESAGARGRYYWCLGCESSPGSPGMGCLGYDCPNHAALCRRRRRSRSAPTTTTATTTTTTTVAHARRHLLLLLLLLLPLLLLCPLAMPPLQEPRLYISHQPRPPRQPKMALAPSIQRPRDCCCGRGPARAARAHARRPVSAVTGRPPPRALSTAHFNHA